MSLIQWRPKKTQNVNDLLNWDNPFAPLSLFPSSQLLNESFNDIWQPAIDISEDKENYYVKADLPGVEKDGIKVEVVDNVLSIKGERNDQQESKDKNFHRIERSYGTFERRFTLGDVKEENIKAQYKDGVLSITIPKAEPVKAKHIAVDVK